MTIKKTFITVLFTAISLAAFAGPADAAQAEAGGCTMTVTVKGVGSVTVGVPDFVCRLLA